VQVTKAIKKLIFVLILDTYLDSYTALFITQ